MRRERGVALVLVLFFALLLFSVVATFLRRSTVDAMIVRNRDRAAQAEALARGGVRVARLLLLEDRLREFDPETGEDRRGESLDDVWARVGELEIRPEERTDEQLKTDRRSGKFTDDFLAREYGPRAIQG